MLCNKRYIFGVLNFCQNGVRLLLKWIMGSANTAFRSANLVYKEVTRNREIVLSVFKISFSYMNSVFVSISAEFLSV
jgi:hypothetical protein